MKETPSFRYVPALGGVMASVSMLPVMGLVTVVACGFWCIGGAT